MGQLLPDKSMKDYNFLQQKYILNTYPNRGLTLIKGEGVYLFATDGKKYLDMMSNYGVNIFGYKHPIITQSLISQTKKLTNLHGSFNNDIRALAAKQLIERCGNKFTQLYFANSGAEAIEAALKFIIVASGKKKIIACENSYHGKTLGALSVTYGEKYRKPFEPFSLDVTFIKFADPLSLEKAIDKNTAAFIVEPIQGEGGLNDPKKGYLEQIKKICVENNVILVFDEIQSGIGRTGKFLASLWDNVTPDILCLGKGLAGGLPIGVTLVNKSIAAKISKNIHTSTFGGNPLTCAGILATLKLLDEKLLDHIKLMGDYFFNKLASIKSNLIAGIRGKGLMLGIKIKNNERNKVLKLLQNESVLAIPSGDDVVRFLPPYIIQKEHIDEVVEKLEKVMRLL